MSDPTSQSREPQYKYDAKLANALELKWQDIWEQNHTYYTPNPIGDLSRNFDASKEKIYILDMFPYPSGAGLHVGHPLGYIATDVYARFKRMMGYNVMHSFGFDAFGLPAEQYAVQTGTHPRITTEKNIAIIQKQLKRIGMDYDPRRSVSTIDPDYYKWTQWVFLQIYNSYFDEELNKARPIEDLIEEFESGKRIPEDGSSWRLLDKKQQTHIIDSYRLAYLADSVVNWCPGLGTVLANEEVTADGKSERGNFDVFKRPMKQWMMRITKYADRLVQDLDGLDWSDAIKLQQINWIGKSRGATIAFDVSGFAGDPIKVFTTRADTIFSAAFVVLAPEHQLVNEITTQENMQAVKDYVAESASKKELERTSMDKEKTGVFTGAYAINPANGEAIPVWVGDFVLAGYGTGAVFGDIHDERDFEFLKKFGIDARVTVIPEDQDEAKKVLAKEYSFTEEGILIESEQFTGMKSKEAKEAITDWLETNGAAESTITYRLRDWLFSRQRYWGEPFPIVFDEDGLAYDLPESMLPVVLPDLDNFAPESSDDPDAEPKPPLGRATDWVKVELDLGDGLKTYRRETNTMPNWAGSCWYYLRYLDPKNENEMINKEVEKYWAGKTGQYGIVDLYVGGAEHAVLHLLYARFWHKVLYDRGYVSTKEPFQRLINQGMIQGSAYKDSRGFYVEAKEVVERDGKYFYNNEEVEQEFGKIGKSLKNMISPDDMCTDYGADTLRMYEMFMGPLEMSRPWSTSDVSGVYRFLQRLWRSIINEETGEIDVSDDDYSEDLKKTLHKTIDAVTNDYQNLSFNTAIAKMYELNNQVTKHISKGNKCPREIAIAMTLMVAPLAPHIAEELWQKLGNSESVVYQEFPKAQGEYLVDDVIEIPVQILGKVKSRINVSPDANANELEEAARADEKIAELLAGKETIKVIAVPGRMVNFVIK
ncbi:MAG: leucine--tRNA ligase [Acidimicrobiia bacterium]